MASPGDYPKGDFSMDNSSHGDSDDRNQVKILTGKLKLSQLMYDQIVGENLKVLRAKEKAEQELRDVKEKLQDLDVAEKNLNRNIDSKAQLELFLGVANDVRNQFKKRYGEKEWNP